MKMILLLSSLILSINTWADKSDDDCQTFLNHINKKEYTKTWDNAATYFQKAISKEQWNKSLEAVHTPLGKVFSRKQISKTPKSKLPGAPDGSYIIYQFQSSFAKKTTAVETITFLESPKNSWKLVGYYIK